VVVSKLRKHLVVPRSARGLSRWRRQRGTVSRPGREGCHVGLYIGGGNMIDAPDVASATVGHRNFS